MASREFYYVIVVAGILLITTIMSEKENLHIIHFAVFSWMIGIPSICYLVSIILKEWSVM